MILTYDNINPMQIQWLGQSCFKIQAKNNGQEITIVTDPYGDDIGLRPLKLQADIVTVSHDHHDHNNLDAIKGDSFSLNTFYFIFIRRVANIKSIQSICFNLVL